MTGPVAPSSFISSLLPAVVFVNPTAGSGRARSFLPRVQRLFQTAEVSAEFVTTHSSKELKSGALAALRSGHRLLLALGGDGTFQDLVNAAYRSGAVLGVLPAGGGNDFAAALQLPEDPVAAAAAILQGKVIRVDLARARTADGQSRLYVGGGGLGIDAEAARFASGTFRHLPGRSRYVAAALRALCGYRPINVRVEFPSSGLPSLQIDSLLAAVLNTPTYGGGIRLAPEAVLDDGWLNTVIVERLSLIQALSLVPRLLASGELHTRKVQHMRARRVRLSTDRPCEFHGDGEILGPTPVEIEVVPQAVQVLAPFRA
jgi:diacylglycerol kinase (ATP)